MFEKTDIIKLEKAKKNERTVTSLRWPVANQDPIGVRGQDIWTKIIVHMCYDLKTCMYYDRSTYIIYDHSTCMYYGHDTCMSYEHSTRM